MDNALIQNRLTILGFTLATLVFMVTFLAAFLTHEARVEGNEVIPIFFWSYVNTFIPIILGFMFCLLGVVSFLGAQWNKSTSLYDFGQIALYLALSQALSGFDEIVARVVQATWDHAGDHRLVAGTLILFLALAAQALWLVLLIAPVMVLRARRAIATVPRRLWLACYACLVIVIVVPGLGFYLRDPGSGRLDVLLGKILVQIVRPLSWLLGV